VNKRKVTSVITNRWQYAVWTKTNHTAARYERCGGSKHSGVTFLLHSLKKHVGNSIHLLWLGQTVCAGQLCCRGVVCLCVLVVVLLTGMCTWKWMFWVYVRTA